MLQQAKIIKSFMSSPDDLADTNDDDWIHI